MKDQHTSSAVDLHRQATRQTRELSLPTALAPVEAAPIVPPASTSSRPSVGRRIDPLASLGRHKALALAIFLLVSLLGLPFAWSFGKKVFYTESVIFVSPRFVKNLQDDTEKEIQSNSQYRDFVQQQMRTVGRFDIVQTALQRQPELMKFWRKPNESEQHAVERLQAALILRTVPETYQFTIGLEADKKDYLSELVNAVTNTFLEMDKRDEVYGKDRRIEDLREEQTRLLAQVKEKMDERTKIAQALGVTTFTGDLINPYDHLIINRKNELAQAQRSRIEKEAELAAGNADTQPTKAALLEQARELVMRDSGLNSLKDRLNERRRDLIARLSGLGANHPGRKDAERELAEMDATIKNYDEKLLDTYAEMLLTMRQAQVKQTQRTEKDLTALLNEHTAQAREFARQYQDALLLGVEISNHTRRLGAVSDRINYLTLEAQAPGFMRLFSSARPPELPFKGGYRKYLTVFLALSLLLALLTPLVIDYLDPRLHTLAEAEAFLGFPPFGGVLRYDDPAARRFAQQQILRMACALEREYRLNGARVFLLTSTEPGSGTSTLALALARSLSQLGRKAVAVEARKTEHDHRYQIIAQRFGIATHLHGGMAKSDIASDNHSLPPSMDDTDLPPSMSSSQSLALSSTGAKLAALVAQYDVVLLDAPPVQHAADAEVLAHYADTTILVIRASATTRQQASQVLQHMERWQLPVIGVALNGLDPQRDPALAALLPRTKSFWSGLSDRVWG